MLIYIFPPFHDHQHQDQDLEHVHHPPPDRGDHYLISIILVLELYKNGIIQCSDFLCPVFFTQRHVFEIIQVCMITSLLFFSAEQFSTERLQHNWIVSQQTLDRQVGCVLFLAIANKAYEHFGGHLQSLIFDKHLGVELLHDSGGECLILLENAKNVSSVTVRFALLPGVRIPLGLHICQHLIWSVFSHLHGCYFFCGLNLHFPDDNGSRTFSWAYWPFSYPLL